MGSYFSHSFTREQLAMALDKVKTTVNSTPVVVFSKTYCGYCKRVKQLLTQVGATYKVIELDEDVVGGEIQAALAEWTRQRSVPNVYIAGKHIGGCDSVLEKQQADQLLPLLQEAGAVVNKLILYTVHQSTIRNTQLHHTQSLINPYSLEMQTNTDPLQSLFEEIQTEEYKCSKQTY